MSDSSNSHAYKIKLLDGAASYPSWSTKMMDILTDQDMDKYVTGTVHERDHGLFKGPLLNACCFLGSWDCVISVVTVVLVLPYSIDFASSMLKLSAQPLSRGLRP
jgi:hypothetical protein